jgi:hypothetical protein
MDGEPLAPVPILALTELLAGTGDYRFYFYSYLRPLHNP